MADVRFRHRYLVAQWGGGFLGALTLYGLADNSDPVIQSTALMGCSWGSMGHGQAFLAEFVFSFFMLFIAYGLVGRALLVRTGTVFASKLRGT